MFFEKICVILRAFYTFNPVHSIMKNKIPPRLATLIMTLVILAGVTSCTDDDPYYSEDILIHYDWELVAVNGIPVREPDVCVFQFFDFGNGTYGRYNEYGSWYEIPIQWETVQAYGGAEYLYVYPSGTQQTWEYLMRIYDGYHPVLELNDLATGDRLTFQPD